MRAVGAGNGPVNDQQIAVENPCSPHGIAGDADVKRRGGMADEILVEVEAAFQIIVGGRRESRRIR